MTGRSRTVCRNVLIALLFKELHFRDVYRISIADEVRSVGESTIVRVIVISLYSLSSIGGGERYTLDTIRAIEAGGDDCTAYAVVRPEHYQPYPRRLATPFVRVFPGNPADFGEVVTLKQLITEVATFDTVVIHQYLSSDIVFDLIGNCASDQTIIFTNLGSEPLIRDFETCFQPSSQCWFIEISDFSAKRSSRFSNQVRCISGGIWRADICPVPARRGKPAARFCSVGRLLPHKGFEVTVDGIPADFELTIIGPQYDKRYWRHIKSRASGKKVTFAGAVSESLKRQMIADSDALIASSHTKLYNGVVIEQAELLGLVIFEALAVNTLPIVSNIPPFREVMSDLGLKDFLYEAGDSASLRERICYLRSVSPEALGSSLETARQCMIRRYLWDDYWAKVKSVARL